MGNTPACVELCKPTVDAGQEDEPFDGVVDSGVIGEIAQGVQNALAS